MVNSRTDMTQKWWREKRDNRWVDKQQKKSAFWPKYSMKHKSRFQDACHSSQIFKIRWSNDVTPPPPPPPLHTHTHTGTDNYKISLYQIFTLFVCLLMYFVCLLVVYWEYFKNHSWNLLLPNQHWILGSSWMGALFPFLFGTCCDESYDVSIKQRFVLCVICTKPCTQQNDQTLSHKVTCFHFCITSQFLTRVAVSVLTR